MYKAAGRATETWMSIHALPDRATIRPLGLKPAGYAPLRPLLVVVAGPARLAGVVLQLVQHLVAQRVQQIERVLSSQTMQQRR